jgi:DNA recombination protein RmuC
MTNDGLVWALLVLVVLNLLLGFWMLLRRRPVDADEVAHRQQLLGLLQQQSLQMGQRVERVESELRREIAENARGGRQEIQQTLATFQETLTRQDAEATRTQNTQLDAFAQQLLQLRGTLGDTLTAQLQALGLAMNSQAAEATRTQNAQIDAFAQQLVQLRGTLGDTLTRQLQDMSEGNARRLAEIRTTLDGQLAQLQQSNAAKLDEMRATVDEKLQSTLQARLGESFKQVADRLEQVLAPDQYATQVTTKPGSRNVVDFAIKLPGRGDDGAPCWLPIDAKFPNEDYERLLDAQQRADAEGAELAARGLEQRIKLEAKSMADKYLEPPHTTDFAILFLPTEGLYAEVLRRPGLMEVLQREYRVTLAGPTTLMAMLNSLQMGFRTLALEKRSSEVWQVLGAVKTEFGKFGDVLAKVKSQTQTVLNTLDSAETRSRAMGRALKAVEALPQDKASALLPLDPSDAADV